MTSPLAVNLLACTKEREKILLQNDPFVAVIYLDPRLNMLLSQEEKGRAKIHLVKLWGRLNENKPSNDVNCQTKLVLIEDNDEVDLLITQRADEVHQ